MDNPERMRAKATHLYALAIELREACPEYADQLASEGIDLLDQATAIDEANVPLLSKGMIRSGRMLRKRNSRLSLGDPQPVA
jgi:hypothetical protein